MEAMIKVSAAHDGLRIASPASRPPLREIQANTICARYVGYFAFLFRNACVVSFLSGKPAASAAGRVRYVLILP